MGYTTRVDDKSRPNIVKRCSANELTKFGIIVSPGDLITVDLNSDDEFVIMVNGDRYHILKNGSTSKGLRTLLKSYNTTSMRLEAV